MKKKSTSRQKSNQIQILSFMREILPNHIIETSRDFICVKDFDRILLIQYYDKMDSTKFRNNIEYTDIPFYDFTFLNF